MHRNMMTRWAVLAGVLVISVLIAGFNGDPAIAQPDSDENYPVPPEALPHPGVPQGEVKGPLTLHSQIYPGTEREYWIYVPAQYDAEKPACVMVVQDGLNRARGWNLPTVMDNLIHQGDMPVTIGIFVNPGVVPPKRPNAQPRFNRSFEYDSLGDRYARFLLEELLPAVGKDYNLSSNPNDRALAGASSGGICALNAAWERPDAFRRVLSTIGSFVGLRGGNQLSAWIRQTEPKPLRIFLQDGSNDLNLYAGDWWVANQDMYSALKWSGYEVKRVWGTGGHNSKHAAAIMPEALRWLWKDWPAEIPVPDQTPLNRRVNILVNGEYWQEVSSGHEQINALTANERGEVFFTDAKSGRVFQLAADHKTRLFGEYGAGLSALQFAPDGKLLAIRDGNSVVEIRGDNGGLPLFQGQQVTALTVLPDFFLAVDAATRQVAAVSYAGQVLATTQVPTPPDAMCATADRAFLHLVDANGQMTWHARLDGNSGTLDAIQPYGYLQMPYASTRSGAVDVEVDRDGHVYVASARGVQVLDQLGRVNIVLLPPSRFPLRAITFGGAERNVLYATDGTRVFARKLNTHGMLPIDAPVEPPRPRL